MGLKVVIQPLEKQHHIIKPEIEKRKNEILVCEVMLRDKRISKLEAENFKKTIKENEKWIRDNKKYVMD